MKNDVPGHSTQLVNRFKLLQENYATYYSLKSNEWNSGGYIVKDVILVDEETVVGDVLWKKRWWVISNE